MNQKLTGYLLAYDISNDKIRRKVEKVASEYGIRIQYSCFYCPIDKKTVLALLLRLNKIIDTKADSIIAVALAEDWQKYTIGTLKNDPFQNVKRVV